MFSLLFANTKRVGADGLELDVHISSGYELIISVDILEKAAVASKD
jgi:hypothetical protein